MNDYTPAVRSLAKSIQTSPVSFVVTNQNSIRGYHAETPLCFEFGNQETLMAYYGHPSHPQIGLSQSRSALDGPRLQIRISYATPQLRLEEWTQQFSFVDEFWLPEETTGVRSMEYRFYKGDCLVVARPTPYGTLGDVKLWINEMNKTFRKQIAELLIDNGAIIRRDSSFHDTEFREPFPQSLLIEFLLEKIRYGL